MISERTLRKYTLAGVAVCVATLVIIAATAKPLQPETSPGWLYVSKPISKK